MGTRLQEGTRPQCCLCMRADELSCVSYFAALDFAFRHLFFVLARVSNAMFSKRRVKKKAFRPRELSTTIMVTHTKVGLWRFAPQPFSGNRQCELGAL